MNVTQPVCGWLFAMPGTHYMCGWMVAVSNIRSAAATEKKRPSEQYKRRQKSVSDCQISACLSVIKAFIFIKF